MTARQNGIRWDLYPHASANPHARAYLEYLVLLERSPKTIDAYARGIDDLVRYYESCVPESLVEADESEILTYLADLESRPSYSPSKRQPFKTNMQQSAGNVRHLSEIGRKDGPLADTTIAQRVVAIRLFYDFLIRRRIRQDGLNPLARGSANRHGQRARRGAYRAGKRLPWTPSDEQWHRIVLDIVAHEGQRNQAMLILAYDAALRREEIVRLRVDDVDFSQATLTVRGEVSKNGRKRVVPFSGFTELLIRRYFEADRQMMVETFGAEPNGEVFLSESTACPGRPLAVGAVNDVVKRVCQRLDLPRLTPHTFRHQRCTILRRAGVALDDIALFAGHKSTDTTRLYIHIVPSELGRTIREKSQSFDAFMERAIGEMAGEEGNNGAESGH